MLKIKDNVDLKELENYELHYNRFEDEEGVDECYCNTIIDIDKKTRKFEINLFNSDLTYDELDGIFELIQAGLVEKVSED